MPWVPPVNPSPLRSWRDQSGRGPRGRGASREVVGEAVGGGQALVHLRHPCEKGAARLAGADGVALRLRRTTVWEDHALKIGPAATVLIDGADTVLVRGRFTRPGAWRDDDNGRRIPTFRASRIVVTD